MTEDGLDVTVRQTRKRQYQYHHNIELNRRNIERLGDDIEEGDRVVVRNHRNEASPACYGRVHVQEGFGDDEAGVGYTLRYAIGAPEGSAVRIERLPSSVAEKPLINRFLERLFGIRPVVCRVRMAVEPDPGFSVCRITEETRELLGIDEGDHVVLESTDDRKRSVKALPLDGNTEKIKADQMAQNPNRYPTCFDVIDIAGVRSTEVDVPPIFIDRDARLALGICDRDAETSIEEGVCQPVVVYRDTSDLFGRVFLEIATPFIIASAAAVIGLDTVALQSVIGFDAWTILSAKVALILVAMVVAIFVVWYRMRIALLD